MNRARSIWSALQSSFWFIPGLVVVASLLAAFGLVELDDRLSVELAQWSPRLFGAGPEGSRAMLEAIATSMVTVAGVVFSITIVTLSLTSRQYSPRVLPNFMRDRPTQLVLGVFLGIFAYCLFVLRTIRAGEDESFVPALAVLAGLAYALAGVAMLIFFIHHVAYSIQASSILDRLTSDTRTSIDHLFPQELGEGAEPVQPRPELPAEWEQLRATHSGYLGRVDSEELMAYARDHRRVLRLYPSIGDFVPEGAPLLALAGTQPVPEQDAERLRGHLSLIAARTFEQDAAFGLSQVVDVAVRALSPASNDIATACLCVDRLGELTARLAGRYMPGPWRYEGGDLLVVAPTPDFPHMLQQSFEPVIRHARGDLQVLERVLVALELVRGAATHPARRAAVRELARAFALELDSVAPRLRSQPLRERLRQLESSLRK